MCDPVTIAVVGTVAAGGMQAYGQIYGRQYAAFLIATGLGPVIFGAVRDASDNYIPSLFIAAAFMLVSTALFAKLPKFQP